MSTSPCGTGDELLIWGGGRVTMHEHPDQVGTGPEGELDSSRIVSGAASFDDGARYDPSTREWARISAAPFESRYGDAAVWTGSQMLVWSPRNHTSQLWAYDPGLDSWTALATPPFEHTPDAEPVWTGEELLVWGGVDHQPSLPTQGGCLRPRDRHVAGARRIPVVGPAVALAGVDRAGAHRLGRHRSGARRLRRRRRVRPWHRHLADDRRQSTPRTCPAARCMDGAGDVGVGRTGRVDRRCRLRPRHRLVASVGVGADRVGAVRAGPRLDRHGVRHPRCRDRRPRRRRL